MSMVNCQLLTGDAMATLEIETKIKFTTLECGGCGIIFALTAKHYQELHDNNGSFFCPNGCNRMFVGETEAEKIKRLEAQLASQKEAAEWYEGAYKRSSRDLTDTKNSLRAHKAAHTKTKNRIKKGICPCCNRQFVNLQRHMETQHPDYNQDTE